jgi:hypothetical protein
MALLNNNRLSVIIVRRGCLELVRELTALWTLVEVRLTTLFRYKICNCLGETFFKVKSFTIFTTLLNIVRLIKSRKANWGKSKVLCTVYVGKNWVRG